jgi:serine O-acetyltransferase
MLTTNDQPAAPAADHHPGGHPAEHALEHAFAEELCRARREHPIVLPARKQVAACADELLGILFPHLSENPPDSAEEIQARLALLRQELRRILKPLEPAMAQPAEATVDAFSRAVPGIYRKLLLDAQAISTGDPAAEGTDEVIAAYPGFLAIAFYRIAHEFWQLGVPVFPRIMSEIAHTRTGVDIHPGASIGSPFFIDHGTGIVVGETALIGNNVKLYQGVTLGALSVDKRWAGTKRHPTIEDNVVIYSNATILGGETVIGHDSIVGGNVWLTRSVPPYSVVYHHSEVRIRSQRESNELPDFVI